MLHEQQEAARAMVLQRAQTIFALNLERKDLQIQRQKIWGLHKKHLEEYEAHLRQIKEGETPTDWQPGYKSLESSIRAFDRWETQNPAFYAMRG